MFVWVYITERAEERWSKNTTFCLIIGNGILVCTVLFAIAVIFKQRRKFNEGKTDAVNAYEVWAL